MVTSLFSFFHGLFRILVMEYNLEYEQSTEVILVGSASTARLATTARAKTTTIKLLEKTLSEKCLFADAPTPFLNGLHGKEIK